MEDGPYSGWTPYLSILRHGQRKEDPWHLNVFPAIRISSVTLHPLESRRIRFLDNATSSRLWASRPVGAIMWPYRGRIEFCTIGGCPIRPLSTLGFKSRKTVGAKKAPELWRMRRGSGSNCLRQVVGVGVRARFVPTFFLDVGQEPIRECSILLLGLVFPVWRCSIRRCR